MSARDEYMPGPGRTARVSSRRQRPCWWVLVLVLVLVDVDVVSGSRASRTAVRSSFP
ncbi:hypothetical protein ACH4ZW_39280 [Streptomyces venezuelae]|uniref:hypothetical protein n=1 Tax=Streptomyces venezuelae TaxID=54571 RepID=UPI0037A08BEC